MEEQHITSVLKEERIFNPPKNFSKNAHIKSIEKYKKIYNYSIKNPEKFWAEKAEQLHWHKKWEKVLSGKNDFYRWFEGGKINVCYNCLDRHLENKGNKIALVWEAEDGKVK